MPFQTTPEHEAIFSEVRNGRGNILIEAVAGGGKTTALLELLKALPVSPDSILPPATCFLAFNKDIAEALRPRVPRHVSCSTFHSLGFKALRRSLPKIQTDFQKVPKLLYARLGKDHEDFDSCRKLVSLLKSRPPEAANVYSDVARDLCETYDLSFAEHGSFGIAVDVFAKSIADRETCDFDDMLFFPVLLSSEFDSQDYVLCDESQDTNEIQLEILSCLGGPSTRYFFVGDRRQAIYGFRGASTDSLSRISQRFQTLPFPLSVTYRCPKAVVAEVRKFL